MRLIQSIPNNVLTWSNASDVALRATGRAVISGSISTAINGGSLGENFLGALSGEGATVAMATGFKWVGDQTIRFDDGSAEKIFAHAIVGGLIAEATGGDFKTGAAAAGLNEALINGLNEAAQGNEQIHMMLSQLTGLVAAVAVGGDLQQGVSIAQAATEYNHNLHLNNAKAAAKAIMQACQSRADLCTGDVSRVTEQDLVYALEVSARHGEGADQLNWDAALLVDQFRALAKQLDDKGLEDDLFTPTESEAHRIAIGDTVEAVGAIASVANAIRLFAKNPSGIVEAVKGLFGGAKGIDKLFEAGRTPKASELKQFAESQGWKPSQTDGGPLKYVDENGIPRVTIKQGSSRAPGSADPHVEFKNAAGQRTDAFGNPVTRKSPDNHTSIDFDL
ncbi:DUF637 domain-containing protein [Pseudomonas sp. 148P]|uniref:DUF637 domain-containing protein n=1 Tax=Pseudomonas ulcerans TaxID=3115852 RepID=A0ABU7I1K1_9PSED|nr:MULTISPECIES: DUF637 domain-containing protein [unclassified Pseudomonas]MEE1926468.1 DUF637 domain-containing protein [Pseudomonas sp. 147P]MEE1937692.1 DUF637 domain-containing protein [Pseudomonas sp. 148P]